MTFEATIVRVTHEGSVLATFEGSVPRLGQRVKDRKGETIGRIDSVIGPVGNPLTNIVILDPHLDANTLIGDTLVFSPRTKKDSGRNDRGRSWNRSSDARRGNQRFRGQDRGRSRDNDRGNQQARDGDWDCKSCGNNNFSFRTECNRCGKSKSGGRTSQRSERRPQRRQDSRSDSRRGPRNNGNRSRNYSGGQRGSRGSNNFRDRNRR